MQARDFFRRMVVGHSTASCDRLAAATTELEGTTRDIHRMKCVVDRIIEQDIAVIRYRKEVVNDD